MQRIDENTYIDDMLVTCAEYQLFIDEMSEEGKYYQPDHWTAYQFPTGQAREPILGVRNSDAMAFCGWLTSRQSKEWKFRLPTQAEVDDFPVKSMEISPYGYWSGDNYQFNWVGTTPKVISEAWAIKFRAIPTRDARALDCNHVIDRALEIGSILAHASDNVGIIPRDSEHTKNHNITRAHNLDRFRARYLDRDLDKIEDRFYNLEHMGRDFGDLARDLVSIENRSLDRKGNDFKDITHDYWGMSGRSIRLLTAVRDLGLKIAFVEDVNVDISTILKRIQGFSPAFEGIRLVKERIR